MGSSTSKQTICALIKCVPILLAINVPDLVSINALPVLSTMVIMYYSTIIV